MAGLRRSAEPLSKCDAFGEREEVNGLDAGTRAFISFGGCQGHDRASAVKQLLSAAAPLPPNHCDGTHGENFSQRGQVVPCRLVLHSAMQNILVFGRKKNLSAVCTEAGCSSGLPHVCPVILAKSEKTPLFCSCCGLPTSSCKMFTLESASD